MTPDKIDSLTDDALNAAVATIQSALGQSDGGFAALWFTGEREALLRSMLADYVRAELDLMTERG